MPATSPASHPQCTRFRGFTRRFGDESAYAPRTRRWGVYEVLKLEQNLADNQTMSDAADLADAPAAPGAPDAPAASVDATLPPPVLPMPTGVPAATSVGAGDEVADRDAPAAGARDPKAAASEHPHAMAAAVHFAAMKKVEALPRVKPVRRQRRRSRGPVVLFVLLLGALAGATYFGRDSALMARLEGEGYDSGALPMIVYPRPTPSGVERSITSYSVTLDAAGMPTVVEEFTDILSNSNTGDREVEQRTSRFAVVDGVPTEPALWVDEREVIAVGELDYISPEVDGQPWEQRDRDWQTTGPDAGEFWMYQDLVDQSLRHVPPVSTVSETFDAVEVTTYTWEMPFGELYESAPFAYSPFGVLDGNADPASTVTLAISVDADGVVRVVDIRLELDSVIDHATAKADGLPYPYGFRLELDSLDDTAPTITAPTNVATPAPPAEPAAEGGA
jgi:hypothetical protein